MTDADDDADVHKRRCAVAFTDDRPARASAAAHRAAGEYLRSAPHARGRTADIVSDAWWGVSRAVARYEVDGGATVWQWAMTRARGAIIDGERVRGPMSRRAYLAAGGIDGVPRAMLPPVSYDALDPERNGRVERGYARVEAAETVRQVLAALPPRHAYVLAQTYLHGRTLADVGAELGITESAASQLRTRALRWAREHATRDPQPSSVAA